MNNRLFDSRFYQILILIIALVLILLVRLFVITVLQNDKWAEAAVNQNTKEITTSAPRGEILDRYGRVIATNKQIFTVSFNVSGLETEEINNAAYGIAKILEANGDEYVDNFPIVIEETEEGSRFSYTFDSDKSAWLARRGFPADFTAEQAFNALRATYEISPDLDRYDAMTELQETYGVWPPINVRSMTYSYDTDREAFLEKYEFDKDLSAERAFKELRKKYSIDESLSDAEARKIFRIREEVKNIGYNKYRSSDIASNVSDATVVYLEEMSTELPGVEIGSESVRYYPNGNLASHILGYMGSISDSQYEEYVTEKGYNATDLIGKDGIEASMESYLKGQDGVTTVRVDSGGNYIETISEKEPRAGKDVYLTIDLELQKTAEDSLEQLINCINSGKRFVGKYGTSGVTRYKNCQSGAVVALDVKTGEVLAMASYPDYDPNMFAEGISTEDWASVQSTNPRDYMAPTPLYNLATKASVQPGSTFKPVTSIAALRCGLDPNRTIFDGGRITIGDRSFSCSSGGGHGYETLATGLQNSCNFYFYCIATGTNWNNRTSLGYKEDISIEKIMEVASEMGLGENTGIELNEGITSLASAEKKMQGMKDSLWYTLDARATEFWPESVVSDEEKLRKDLDTIVSWTEENPPRDEIIKRVKEQTSVEEDKAESITDLCKYSFFNMAQWTVGDEFNIAIGQGDNAYTPLQMANYAATLGNGGVRNKVRIVKGIEGVEGYRKNDETYKVDVDEDDLAVILKGMNLVTRRGTLAGVFSRLGYQVAAKTGTAERAGRINPLDEVAYVKSHLRSIVSGVSWEDVEEQMAKLMKENREKYPTENDAVDMALIKASGNKVTQTQIDRFKDTYDNFAWVISIAPLDDPQIAVAVMLVQGGISYNAGPLAREIIGTYLDNESTYDKADFTAKMQ